VKFSIQDVTETRKTAVIVVPKEQIAEEEQSLLKKYAGQLRIPGFRPGKAPLDMVRNKYRKELAGELTQNIISSIYNKLTEESDLNIYGIVNVNLEPDPMTPGNEGVVTFTLDIKPSFELPEYKGISLTLEKPTVSEEDIDKAIENIRQQRAEYKEVEEPAKKGDYVKLSYSGKLDGKPVSEILPDKPIYGEQNNTWEEAGAEEVPGVRAIIDGIVGMKKGDEKDVKMSFPENFSEPELAGKDVDYHLEIHEVRQKILPELDDAFIKGMQVETLEELRNRIKEEFLKQRENEMSTKARDQIIKYLTDKVDFDIPESAVEHQTNSLLRSYMTQMIQRGAIEEQFEEQKDKLFEEARKAARTHAKTTIILEEIAKKEDIQVENQDLNMRIMQEAMMTGMKPQDFVNELKKDRQRVQEIRQNALVNKVLDFLHQESKVEHKEDQTSKS